MVIFSSLISTISTSLMEYASATQSGKEQMKMLSAFLRQSRTSRALGMDVRKQVQDRMAEQKPLTFERVSLLSTISLSLHSRLLVELHEPYVMNHPFFNVLAY